MADKINENQTKVGTVCGYRIGSDAYASKIKEYKILPRNTHILYLEDGTQFKYNKNKDKWFRYVNNNSQKYYLDFTITKTYLDPGF